MPDDRPEGGDATLDERRLRRLIDVGRALVSELDLDTVLNRVLEAARDVTGARYAAVGILDAQRTGLERFLNVGMDERMRRAIGSPPSGHGVLGLPIVIRGEAFGNIYLIEKQEGDFDAADEEAALILAEWAAVAIDNARLYTDARDRRVELERAIRGLEATTEIARAVGGETDLERVLETIAKRGRALVEARAVIILLEDGGELEVVIAAGELDRDLIGERLPLDSPWGDACRKGLPQRIGSGHALLGAGSRQLDSRADAALLAPLTFRGQGLGLIVAFDRVRSGPDFDADDEALLLSFAASAATAVATAQSIAEDRVRFSIEASERERSKWASELHDETLQGLGALRVTLSAALKGDQERLAATAEAAVAQLAGEIATLRALIAELRPVALDELGLEAALESLVEHHSSASGLDIRARVELHGAGESDDRRLDPEIESSIYRVVQEALTNIGKHSRAEHVDLEIARDDGWVTVRISDDGVGFDTSAPGDGFGLRGMRERTTLVNGTMSVRSSPGSGTRIELEVPTALRGRPRPPADNY